MANQMSVSLSLVGGVKTKQSKKDQKSAQDDLLGFGQALMDAHAANQSSAQTQNAKPESAEKKPASDDGVKAAGKAEQTDTAETAVQGRIVRAENTTETAVETESTEGFLGELFMKAETDAEAEGIPVDGLQTAETAKAEIPVLGETVQNAAAEAVVLPETEAAEGLPVQTETKPQRTETESKVQGAETLKQAETAETAETGQTVIKTEKTETDAFAFSGQQKAQGSGKKTGETKQTDGEETGTQELFAPEETAVHAASTRQEVSFDTKIEASDHVTETGEMNLEYAEALKNQIAHQIIQGKDALKISLSPRSLGNLTIRVAHEAGRTMISVICSDQRAMRAMSEKAQELGQVLEDRLGTRTEVQVDGEREQSRFYQDGRGQNAGRDQENRSGNQKKREEAENADFLQQLRLGLV